MRLNPRFSVFRRILENSSKTPPFCFATELRRMGPAPGCCNVYPGRLDISSPEDGAIHIQKLRRNVLQRCYQQYPRFKEKYPVEFTGDDRTATRELISLWEPLKISQRNLFCRLSNAIFTTFLFKANEQFNCRNTTDNLYLPIPQYLEHYRQSCRIVHDQEALRTISDWYVNRLTTLRRRPSLISLSI